MTELKIPLFTLCTQTPEYFELNFTRSCYSGFVSILFMLTDLVLFGFKYPALEKQESPHQS